MEIKNYTSFWNMEKKLYALWDIQLPFPISLRVAGVFVGTIIPWGVLMWILHVPLTDGFGLLAWLAPPILLAWVSGRPILEDKTIIEYATSRLKYLRENRHYKRLEPDLTKYDVNLEIEQNVITYPNEK